jgi:hypothetical protein
MQTRLTEVQSAISQALRAVYELDLRAPPPQRITDILRKLDGDSDKPSLDRGNVRDPT